MNCEESQSLIDGYMDEELDLVNHLQIEKHLEECPACGQIRQNNLAVKSALADRSLYFRSSDALRERITDSIRAADSEPFFGRFWRWRWMPALASAALAVSILIVTLILFRPIQSNEDLLAQEAMSAHVRSMMLDHLIDVPSTDQHTVKPWFDDKLDFSPPVVDLSSQGFALIGGRLDYISGRPVAAIVYQRRLHKINLFVFPSQNAANSPGGLVVKQGINLVHWNRNGMTFWAVSDLNAAELQEFAKDLQN